MFLTTGNYVDMFPHTDGILDMFPYTDDIHSGVSGHVESVALLQKSNTRGKKAQITLDVEMDDYHRIKNAAETESL